MKTIFALVVACACAGCATDFSFELPIFNSQKIGYVGVSGTLKYVPPKNPDDKDIIHPL